MCTFAQNLVCIHKLEFAGTQRQAIINQHSLHITTDLHLPFLLKHQQAAVSKDGGIEVTEAAPEEETVVMSVFESEIDVGPMINLLQLMMLFSGVKASES